MIFRSAVALCTLFLSAVTPVQATTSGQTLTYCNGCSEFEQKQFAQSKLNTYKHVFVFDKSNEKLTKWGLHVSNNDGGPLSGQDRPDMNGPSYAVKLSLNSSDLALRDSIVEVRSAIATMASSSPNVTVVDMYHDNFNSAADAIFNQGIFTRALYNQLRNTTAWVELEFAIRNYQNELRDSVQISYFGIQFTSGPDVETFFIEVRFEDGSTAKLKVDTKKNLDEELYKSIEIIEAKDESGRLIALDPEFLAALAGEPGGFYSGDNINLDALSRLYSQRFGAAIREFCSQTRTELYCYVQTRAAVTTSKSKENKITVICHKYDIKNCQ